MKKILALCIAFASTLAFSAADDVIFQQRNSTDTATVPKLPPHPTSGFGLVAYDGTSLILGYLQTGPGLSVSGGVIDVVPGGAPSWVSITGKPTSLSGYGITDAYPLTGNPSGFLTGISSAQVVAALGFTPYSNANLSGFITSAALSPYATSASVSAGLAGKFSNPTGSTAQYIRGDGSLATLPVSAAFNYGSINTRTFAVSTAYQATDNTKAAVVKVSPSCTASLTLSAGGTCTIQARVGSSSLTCSTGTVVATWTNANTGTLTIGLGLNQIIGSPGNIELAIGEYFILCATSGTFTIANGIDRSQG